LAEIADKTGSIAGLWFVPMLFALLVLPFSIAGRVAAWGVMAFAALLSLFLMGVHVQQAFFEGHFSALVWSEMGVAWVIHALLSSASPVVLALVVFVGYWGLSSGVKATPVCENRQTNPQ